METAPLRNFATWARTSLIREVTARVAAVLAPGSSERVEEAKAVAALERAVIAAGGGDKGRDAVADKVAYTWFNRIIALRFMDANGYTGIGIVSPQAGVEVGQPEILAEAKRGVIDTEVASQATRAAVAGLLDGTRASGDPQGEAYALLLADYCRHWNKAMPFMFEREGDFTELLIPANLLADDSVLNRSVKVLTEKVCQDVEVIGWLYQFYISERKDEIFAGFSRSKKAEAADLSPATQLFTPHWIVRYLVENSLGRLWMLNRPSSGLVNQMDYYIAPVDDERDFLKVSTPEELKVIDPACGSGHMLTYAFDILYAIYEEDGYGPAEIPELILSKNLFGAELDPRAAALAAFALTMKARARQRTFFSRRVDTQVCAIEPVEFSADELQQVPIVGDPETQDGFWNQFRDAAILGSLIQPSAEVLDKGRQLLEEQPEATTLFAEELRGRCSSVIRQAELLLPRYHVVVANPPYMGQKNMSPSLSEWLKRTYKAGRADLFAAFIERCVAAGRPQGLVAMVTLQSWMFLKSYQELREELLREHAISSFVHMRDSSNHADIFGANSAFVISLKGQRHLRAPFIRLDQLGDAAKRAAYLEIIGADVTGLISLVTTEELCAIPRAPIAYWMSHGDRDAFRLARPVRTAAPSGNGLTTANNDRFLRFWWEVGSSAIEDGRSKGDPPSRKRWHPLNKGGAFRRWAGNQEFVIDWDRDGQELKDLRPRSTIRNEDHYFKESVSWSDVTSGAVSFRHYPRGFIFAQAANSLFPIESDDILGLLALGNSSFVDRMAPLLNPGLHFQIGDAGVLPYLTRSDEGWQDEIRELIAIAQADWDSSETSRGFRRPWFLPEGFQAGEFLLADIFESVAHRARSATLRVRELEDKNNRELTEQHELDPSYAEPGSITRVSLYQNPWWGERADLPDESVTDLQRSRFARDLVSFAVGCMFGRFSLEEPGLVVADPGATLADFNAKVTSPSFMPDVDNVIPILDGDWFEDDVVGRFREFLRAAFGTRWFEENLGFVSRALGVSDLREYFVRDFYEDHVRRYRKRPIYWLFSSPDGSFGALVYMHRYTRSTASTVLNNYLREYRAKVEATLRHNEHVLTSGGTPREVASAQRAVDRYRAVLLALDGYEHDVLYPLASQNVAIDLDDGVKANYPQFGTALRKIVGLEATE